MTTTPHTERRVRTSDEIRAQLDAVRREGIEWYIGPGENRYTVQQFFNGVLETLRWAAGERLDAPASRMVFDRPLSRSAADAEQAFAERGMESLTYNAGRDREFQGLSMRFLTAVEHTTAWLAGYDNSIVAPNP